jgi:hypothetical protein
MTSALNRFAKKTPAAAAAPAAPLPPPKAPEAPKAAPTPPLPPAAAVQAAPTTTVHAGTSTPALMQRLIKLNQAASNTIAQTFENAPVNEVAPRSVGIVPPDAAPEWNAEQQDAHAADIEAGKKGLKGSAALPEHSPTAQAAQAVVQEQAEAKAAAPKRGKAKKALEAPADGTVVVKHLPNPGDETTIEVKDGLAQLAASVSSSVGEGLAQAVADIGNEARSTLEPRTDYAAQAVKPGFMLLIDAGLLKGQIVQSAFALMEAADDVGVDLNTYLRGTPIMGVYSVDSDGIDKGLLGILINRASFVIKGTR